MTTAPSVPSHRTLSVAIATCVANLALFVLIAERLLDGGTLIARDQAVMAWFVEHRTDATVRAAKIVSAFGGFAALVIVAVALGLWLWHRR